MILIHKKRLLLALGILILVVNAFTIGQLFDKPCVVDTVQFFGKPDEIILSYQDERVDLTTESEYYEDLLNLNVERISSLSYYIEVENISLSDKKALRLEYQFNKAVSLSLPLQYNNETFTTQNLYFILTGENNGKLIIKTTDGYRTFGFLPINVEMNELLIQKIFKIEKT